MGNIRLPLLPVREFPVNRVLSCHQAFARIGRTRQEGGDWDSNGGSSSAITSRMSTRDGSEALPIVVAGTFTTQPVLPSLSHCLQIAGVDATCTSLPAGQIIHELVDPAVALLKNAGGVNVVLIRPEDWEPAVTAAPSMPEMAGHFIDALQAAAPAVAATWIVVSCPPSPMRRANGETRQTWDDVTRRVERELESAPGVYVIRGETALERGGVREFYDAQADRLGRIPYTREAFAALGAAIARVVHGVQVPPRKVIVLDCDQTLWDGVCGEDGAAGLRCDGPRRFLQEFMLAQMRTGALLCLCSKNEEADVRRVFAERTDLALSSESFVASRINWRPKSENLRSLAEELGLGLDTFIFVDDDPRECEEVRSLLPEVLTVQLPRRSAEIPALLQGIWAFDRLKITSADRERTQQYRIGRQRDALRRQAGSVDEFVSLLELRVNVRPADRSDLSRLSQLTYRTTQFNCSLKRRSEAEMLSVLSRSDHEVLAVDAADRLEDYGLVGAIILRQRDELYVDTWLLSCRALGRGIEQHMLAGVEACARDRHAVAAVIPFVPGARNQLAKAFLDRLPLPWRRNELSDGACEYRLSLS
jgi:FkbH-like protein